MFFKCLPAVFKTEGSLEISLWSAISEVQEGVGINCLQKEGTSCHICLWLGRKQNPSTCLGGIDSWAERDKELGKGSTFMFASCLQGLAVSFLHLPFSSLCSCYSVMGNKISPVSRYVGSGAFTLLDCLFFVSGLALSRDWKGPALGASDLPLMNAAFIT